jgi:hypothetical protein
MCEIDRELYMRALFGQKLRNSQEIAIESAKTELRECWNYFEEPLMSASRNHTCYESFQPPYIAGREASFRIS